MTKAGHMPKYLTVAEAAERLRKSPATVRRYIKEKKIVGAANDSLVDEQSIRVFLGEAKPKERAGALIMAIANQKGGVGKTTTSVNMAAALAKHGQRVLLVDFDPQGGCSVCLGVNADAMDETLYNGLRNPRYDVRRGIVSLAYGFDFAPANADLSGAEVELIGEMAGEMALQRTLAPIRDGYDFVLIDTPPTLGMLTLNALTAADVVIVPMSCEAMAARGLKRLFDTVSRVQDNLNASLDVMGIIATQYEKQKVANKNVYDQLTAFCKARGIQMFDPPVPRRAKFQDALASKIPAVVLFPDMDASEAYMAIAQEITAHAHA